MEKTTMVYEQHSPAGLCNVFVSQPKLELFGTFDCNINRVYTCPIFSMGCTGRDADIAMPSEHVYISNTTSLSVNLAPPPPLQ